MKDPIRILHVVTQMGAGGIENMLMTIYRNIDRSKIQFDFLVQREEKGFFDDEILLLGGRVFKIMPLSISKLFAYRKQLNNFFVTHKEYKIVHSHISVWSYLILKSAKRNNIPARIAHSHETHDSIWDHKLYRVPLIYCLRQIINSPTTHRFACSTKAGEWLFGKNKDFAVVNNAIDTSLFSYDQKNAEQQKSSLNIYNSLVIGHVGNFSKPKNYPFILKVFSEILKKRVDAKLLLVGDYKNNLNVKEGIKALGIENAVIFTGLRSDVYNMYQVMDVFLFPSHNEGLGISLIEAQASGLKIFASDTIPNEVLLTNDLEFLPLTKTAEYWAARILFSIPYDRKDNIEKIKVKGYDIKENACKLEEFYLNLLNS
ncbi:glycosyltransferase family 1 protein [Kaistella antarctica]|uniref:Mannosylfructose-phosphate synthase n=1 Tax=Kaistella antarctica TaxID=266748 RepID=A0A448NRF9_9FLAO|nr:glycosyltransferase family 1 protein [Kaistella antarctica]KEY18786.1 hypothetical protein HY04_09950 [Kaistella antarctica]SEW15440.1 Glycosyltransferase involved in cell wall bisynthesis [Kaistella antarctica]VEH99511.1 Mannosylfructose-phosphate synthase [Kaistella antarctica]